MSENKIDDGGPAFPLTEDAVNFKNRDFPMQGMSLHDWFMGKALQGELAAQSPDIGKYNLRDPQSCDQLALRCRNAADAMIRARKPKP